MKDIAAGANINYKSSQAETLIEGDSYVDQQR